MTIQQAYQQTLSALSAIYEHREAGNIADIVIEKISGLQRVNRLAAQDLQLSEEEQQRLQQITADLLTNKPVQYTIGHAWFMNMMLQVNESVLIPRPETEELADWLIKDIGKSGKTDASVLDIGTGSGCIPISIKKHITAAAVSAIDISEAALQLAKINAIEQQALIDFLHVDILDPTQWKQLGRYDIIVSNPPYVTQKEAQDMHPNVLDHEPHLALFVPNENPLLFFKAIAAFANEHLKPNGLVYVEINERYAADVADTFQQAGSNKTEIRQDMQGKDRMIKACY